MRIGNFEVKINLPGVHNVWAQIMLFAFILFLAQGIATTHWMASWRRGDSIIPRENELVWDGPYIMSKVKERGHYDVKFSAPGGLVSYQESTYGFDVKPENILGFIDEYARDPVAYLLIYKGNPIKQIWGVRINNYVVQSYKASVAIYRFDDSSNYVSFWIALALFIWFLVSIFDIRKMPA